MIFHSKVIKLHDKIFRKYISKDTIKRAVKRIATEINTDYKNTKPLILPILNGSYIFAADLSRCIELPIELSFIKTSSYIGTESGELISIIGLTEDIKERDIIIIEDIVDTGKTAKKTIDELYCKGAKSVKLAVLLFKPDSLKVELKIDYIGIEIKNEFVVGYGLDYNGLGRNLSHIYRTTE